MATAGKLLVSNRLFLAGALGVAAVSCLLALKRSGNVSLLSFIKRFFRMRGYRQYPRQYVARKGTPPVIDGDLEKDCWKPIPWSEPFVEIRGPDAPAGTGPRPTEATRMKMMWDDEYLYIAATIDIAAGDELVADFKERNSPIFHTDSDFEVFVDVDGSCKNYKELEMNAINTVWNLMLDKPYSVGGKEYSGRVAKPGESEYWEVQKQRTATKITKGALREAGAPSQWVCEIALAHTDTTARNFGVQAPKFGDSWRINFSRVEKQGAVNWVWSPQVVYNCDENRYRGEVNMHLPDAWGYVLFADSNGQVPGRSNAQSWRDPAWPARHAATSIFYAIQAYEGKKGATPSKLSDLKDFLANADLPSDLKVNFGGAASWSPLEASSGGYQVTLHDDRSMSVRKTA